MQWQQHVVACALILMSASAQAATESGQPTPGFNNKIPEKVMTPDAVQTRIGTLKFVDGVPTPDTMQKVYDHLDFLRGVEVFLNLMPAASLEALRLGSAKRGAIRTNQAVIFDQLMDSNPWCSTIRRRAPSCRRRNRIRARTISAT